MTREEILNKCKESALKFATGNAKLLMKDEEFKISIEEISVQENKEVYKINYSVEVNETQYFYQVMFCEPLNIVAVAEFTISGVKTMPVNEEVQNGTNS